VAEARERELRLERVAPGIYELEPRADARVPARVVASAALLGEIRADRKALEQLRNVATLPGAVGCAWAMPDMHMGYGFPIGGVAATDASEGGVISPGGVGYDINCGVRLIALELEAESLRAELAPVADALYREVPCGVGNKGELRLSARDLERVLEQGARFAVDRGYGSPQDLEHVEERGCIVGADPQEVSAQARARGRDQLGTLGSGNHFLELGYVDEIYEPEEARALGLRAGGVTVLLHSGSRGLGHQVCSDFLKRMQPAMRQHGIRVPDPQLCCARLDSSEGRAYLGAMNAAVNFAFANRQALAALAVRGVARGLGIDEGALRPRTVYEVAHNIAKLETHPIGGRPRRVCVHRKGATRAFAAGRSELPADYRAIGQPVLIPGDMERASYVLVGRPGAMEHTFGSSCHGAGRRLSRRAARKQSQHRPIARELEDRGILVRAASLRTAQEETAAAYKDASQVVEAVAEAGLTATVARLRPLAVVKG
jgi:tRNA-splicing ligase RtcB